MPVALGSMLFEKLIYTLDRIPRRRMPAGPQHLATGREGELAAFFYLQRKGCTVVARDWKSGRAPGDIDLIVWEGNTLCFVEVKTRTTRDFATAEAAVDEHKRRTLRRLARHYLRQLPDGTLCRFDILSVYFAAASAGSHKRNADFEYFPAAFTWS